MNRQLKHYLPIALCCIPGLMIALLVSAGGLLNIFPAGVVGLICPVAMVFMMILMNRQERAEKNEKMVTVADRRDLPKTSPEDLGQIG